MVPPHWIIIPVGLILLLQILQTETSSSSYTSSSSAGDTGVFALPVAAAGNGNWSQLPTLSGVIPSALASAGTPKCQWVSEKALECHIRTLDDNFGTWVTRGNWLLFSQNNRFKPGEEKRRVSLEDSFSSNQDTFLTSSSPVFSWSSNSNRGDVRQATSLHISCSKLLFYQSSLSSITFQVSSY